jgi:predicted Zn-dependent protease
MSHDFATLAQLADAAQQLARRLSPLVDDVEVWVTRRDLVAFGIENRHLAPELKLGRLQVALRAIHSGGLAVAATTSLDPDENEQALRAAVSAVRPARVDRFGAQRIAPTAGGHDASLAQLASSPKALMALATGLRDQAFDAVAEHPHVDAIEGRVALQTRWTAMATREGSGAMLENGLVAHASANRARVERLVLRSAEGSEELLNLGARAVRSLPPVRLSPAEVGLGPASVVPALLEPWVVESLLRIPAHDNFLASSLMAGQSTLTPGQRIASPGVTLYDTARPRALARAFDDELTPRDETPLIEDGLFCGFVTSRASARATGLRPTGNGVRSPILAEEPNEAPVRDRLLGLEMRMGTRSSAELVAALPLAIVPRALLGIHGADRARSSFSATVADGLVLRFGEVVGQMAPGRWNVSGRVLPGQGEPGLLESAQVSSDRIDTGTALLPHLTAPLVVG